MQWYRSQDQHLDQKHILATAEAMPRNDARHLQVHAISLQLFEYLFVNTFK